MAFLCATIFILDCLENITPIRLVHTSRVLLYRICNNSKSQLGARLNRDIVISVKNGDDKAAYPSW